MLSTSVLPVTLVPQHLCPTHVSITWRTPASAADVCKGPIFDPRIGVTWLESNGNRLSTVMVVWCWKSPNMGPKQFMLVWWTVDFTWCWLNTFTSPLSSEKNFDGCRMQMVLCRRASWAFLSLLTKVSRKAQYFVKWDPWLDLSGKIFQYWKIKDWLSNYT